MYIYMNLCLLSGSDVPLYAHYVGTMGAPKWERKIDDRHLIGYDFQFNASFCILYLIL